MESSSRVDAPAFVESVLRERYRLLYWVAGGVFVLLAGWMVLTSRGVASPDAVQYMEASRDVGSYDSAFHPPLYPLAIAVFELVARDEFLAAKLVSLVSGVALVFLTGRVGARCFGKAAGLLGAAWVAVSPTIIEWSGTPMSDMMGAALFLLAIACLANIDGHALTPALMTGVACGLAYLTRYVFVAALLGALAYVLVLRVPARRRLLLAAALVGAFFAIVAPWLKINFERHGNFHNDNHVNVAFAMFDTTANWNAFDDYQRRYPSFASLILAHPLTFVRHIAKNAFHFPEQVILRCGLVGGVLALPGVFFAMHRAPMQRFAVFFPGSLLFVLTMMTWYEDRFFVALLPLVLVCGASFCVTILAPRLDVYWPGAGQRLAARIPVRPLAVAGALLVSVGDAIPHVRSSIANANINDEKAAGAFIRQNSPPSTRVLATNTRITWYADRRHVSMHDLFDVTPETLEERLGATGADLFVFTGRHGLREFPQLEYVLHPTDARVPTSFHAIYEQAGPYPAVIYRIGPRQAAARE